jgi:cell division protein FtsW (lipid II flippase)
LRFAGDRADDPFGQGDYRKFFDVAYIVYGISVVFLILVLVMGRQALGATRWFSIAGVSFQPSEFSKLAIIFFLGRYFSASVGQDCLLIFQLFA